MRFWTDGCLDRTVSSLLRDDTWSLLRVFLKEAGGRISTEDFYWICRRGDDGGVGVVTSDSGHGDALI